jgi:hypothetical protein
MQMEDDITLAEELSSLNMTNLKQRLDARGMPRNGPQPVLRRRLLHYLQQRLHSKDAAGDGLLEELGLAAGAAAEDLQQVEDAKAARKAKHEAKRASKDEALAPSDDEEDAHVEQEDAGMAQEDADADREEADADMEQEDADTWAPSRPTRSGAGRRELDSDYCWEYE